MSGPLSGIRVVDLTTVFSGPYATVLLADLGADVIKIEKPGGEITRQIGPSPSSTMGPLFVAVDRNKRCVCLDLQHERGRAVLDRLLDQADVVVHNMRPSAARRLGVDAETTRAGRPRLIHCAIFGFGSDGPYADLPAYDDVIQAATGLIALGAVDERPYEYVRTVVADKTAGLAAFGAICAALVQRTSTGEGCAIEVPMFETFTSFLLLEHLYGRTYLPPTGTAGYERILAPNRRPFRTADGWLSVVFYDERQWKVFFDLIGKPELLQDERFADHRSRIRNNDALQAMAAEALRTRTTAEWLAVLRPAEVPAMPVVDLDGLLEDPHLDAVGMFVPDEHPTEGPYLRVRNPIRFSTGLDDGRLPAPLVGEHTREVLHEAGFGDGEIAELARAGIVYAAN